MKRFTYILILACAVLSTACKQTQKPSAANNKTAVSDSIPSTSAESRGESSTLASKGIITSMHDVPVYSMVSEVIKQKYIKEGMRVNKGQVLFTLDGTMQQTEIDKTLREIDQAKFQYDNILVGQGYDPAQPSAIPLKIRNIARTRSSLDLYEQTLRQQRLISGYYTITAPTSGVVTDVQAYQYDLAEKGKELCRIVDTDHLNVQFSILENELSMFQKGTVVHFSTLAYPNDVYSATVSQISPKIDENGMVKIKAAVNINHSLHQLIVGMTAIVRK